MKHGLTVERRNEPFGLMSMVKEEYAQLREKVNFP